MELKVFIRPVKSVELARLDNVLLSIYHAVNKLTTDKAPNILI